ncbi:MAG: radical SAM-associated putative lipoprotein [Bacteroidales bacterium]|nr:radical SAM-associated putative lipoprotein [Bacteroidales bacterium]
MKIKLLKTYNILITGLLSILGFAIACDSMDEYGTPTAKFIVNGKVKSSKTNQPIENIRVSMLYDTTYTDKNGAYQVVETGEIHNIYNIEFKDIDGETNGEFNNLDTVIEFKNPKFTGGDGNWYKGETSKEYDIKLTPKK